MRYRDAGVDIGRGDSIKEAIALAVHATWGPAVHPLPGGFAGVIEWPGGPPLLAATMDGVGTKLHLALEVGRAGDAAADLVYHGANDLLAHGARPLAFLDYVAQSRLDPELVESVVKGMARACAEVGAALLGGETAQMPDTYLPGVIDVAGCMLGTVMPASLLGVASARAGDRLLGLGSAGLHTNGFSLARKVLAHSGLSLGSRLPGGDGESVADALLAPHRWYGPSLLPAIERGQVRALAHVTGGGIAGNVVRVLPEGARAGIDPAAWPRPALFRWLMEAGNVPEDDARAAFNLGIGMVVVCPPEEVDALELDLRHAGETVWRVGDVETGPRSVRWRS